MDNFVGGLIGLVAIVVVVFVIAYLWEIFKRMWWSDDELLKREMAHLDREAAKAERVAKRDERAFRDTDRRRIGAFIVAAAIGSLVFQLNLPWWHGGMIVAATYVGVTMAAGLAFKW